jgi:hypothetical protein
VTATSHFDAAVVGAGPAGLCAARIGQLEANLGAQRLQGALQSRYFVVALGIEHLLELRAARV